MIRIVLALTLTLLAAAGCGRRGALEAPGSADPMPGVGTAGSPAPLDPTSPGAQEPAAERPGTAAPERRFILDPLI